MKIRAPNMILNRPNRLTSLKGSLATLCFLGILVMNFETSFAAINVAQYLRKSKEHNLLYRGAPSKEICKTPECVKAASTILSNMDKSVDPCTDFYSFTCGNFVKNSVIPDDKSSIDVFSKISDKLQEQLRASIEDGVTDRDPRAFKLLQSYYKTCMDTAQIEKTSDKDFREIMKNFGGWPVLEGKSWDESKFDWKEVTYKFRNTGYSFDHFVYFGAGADMKNNSRRVLSFEQARLGLDQEYLANGLEDKVVQAYFKYMIDIAEIFGANREKAKKELAESLNFEIELAKISLPSDKPRDMEKFYNPTRVSELESKYPGVPWIEYINNILAPHIRVQSDEEIIVLVPSFLEALPALIAKTPKRVLGNYVLWRIAADSASLLGERVQKALSEFMASLTGTSVRQPRWKECVDYVSGNLYIATGALYVRRNFDESAKANAAEIMQDIRKSFENLLTKVDWMDEKTRKVALEKLARIQPHVAHPSELLDDQKLDEYYQHLKIYPESYFKSDLSLSLFYLERDLEELKKPVNKTDWTTYGDSAVVNAFYAAMENSIIFPAGILQGEFFTNNRPNYLNFGGIGCVMGHEMTHGFDDTGRQFDKEGNLVEWWEPATKEKYLQRVQCIIDQYGNYTAKQVGLKLNGANTQGENIADNGGIKEAYFAYNSYEARKGVQPSLPGLPYTSQQMFWISSANIWCEKIRPEALESQITTDTHSPGEFRVNGPFSNMPEFAKDFNCPVGSNMNPIKRCTVW